MTKQRKTFKQGISQEYVDEETGEVFRQYVVTEQVEGYTDVKLPNKAKFNNGAFITVFQKRIFDIVTKADLNKGEMKLLLYLLATTQIDNSIVIDLNILSEDLKTAKANISASLKGLTDRNIVIRKDGYRGGNVKCLPMELRVNYDQLNYDLAYNGKIKDYRKNRPLHPEIEAVSLKEIEEKKPNLFNLLKDED
ncbi:hypothetical protein PG630_10740 [Riemerella anatipestifer]|nr:hypothetical protein [Riemerella anatipestifer]